MMDTKRVAYEQPAVAVDLVLFTVHEGTLQVLLAPRGADPFAGRWSIPGGFLCKGEALEAAAWRVMQEHTGVQDLYLEQLYTFGDPARDPRRRVITVTYLALTPWHLLPHPPVENRLGLAWCSIDALPELAFDHAGILAYAVNRLRAKAGYSNIAYSLLPESFRLSDLQKVYEIILDKKIDKRNFRKRMLETGLLQETGLKDRTGAHRPAMLYRFKQREVIYFD
jgi:8-oxo-dGTP diphosphatase